MSGTEHSLEEYVRRMQRSSRNGPCITRVERMAATQGAYADYPSHIHASIRQALQRRGVQQPYAHQVEAWQAIAAGAHVAVVSPTASGKSLCYHVPVLNMLATERDGSALYLYPTKALSQDQCAELNQLLDGAGLDQLAHVYDGDTPADIRRKVREGARLVVTNPDMLHASILAHHDKWRTLFSTLRYIVIDEMHMYRGVFGSHVANVIRRLRRVCRHYGASPQVVLTSATLANPSELGQRLVGDPVVLVQGTTAPRGERMVMLYNPPIMDKELERRQSPGSAASFLTLPLLEDGHHVIVFARSRQGVEVLTRRMKEQAVKRRLPRLVDRISGYRGGYLPEARRRIERGLRDGEIQAVISTNALELGIDIGSLDVCVMAGYPGTIASFWQQAGRAGRRSGSALVVLVAGDDPVDQFLVHHPDYFFKATPEHGRIDPDNLRIVSEHLKCAAFEIPFRFDEAFLPLDVPSTQEILAYLSEEAGILQPADGVWNWAADGYPASTFGLRALNDENFVIVDTTGEQPDILGEIDYESAHLTVYEQAIYQHDATLYEVHRLDYHERKAYVRRADVDYFTQAIDQTRVFVLDIGDEVSLSHGWGEVRVTTRIAGYKKIRFKTWENIGYGEIQLPDLELHTTSFWSVFRTDRLRSLGLEPRMEEDALLGISKAMHTVAVVQLMCAPGDLKVTLQSRFDAAPVTVAPMAPAPGDSQVQRGTLEGAEGGEQALGAVGLLSEPAVFLYDAHPGGVGFAEKLWELQQELIRDTHSLIADCPCTHGCPSCVGPPVGENLHVKAIALKVLERFLPV